MDRRTRALLEAPIASTLLRLAAPNVLVLAAQAAASAWPSRENCSHAASSRPISSACCVMSKAFATVLKANGDGALLNVLSITSWRTAPTTSWS
jgi:hypothetical protein